MSVLNYAKVTKNCTIKGIFMERMKLKKMREHLYMIWRCLIRLANGVRSWTIAYNRWMWDVLFYCGKNFGSFIKGSKRKDELIKLVKKCSKLIKEFYTDLKLVRGKSVLEDGRKLYQVLCEIKALNTEKHITMQPFFHILERVENQVAFFQNEI